MGSIPFSPDEPPAQGESYREDRRRPGSSIAEREVPPAAREFLAQLRNRAARDGEIMVGGSYADMHLARTGHVFERGCCVLPANRCDGCRKTLPRSAKVKGEHYCSRACREAATIG
jgi:hypothetical protein